MNSFLHRLRPYYKEIAYQTAIVLVLFIFFSYNQEESERVSLQSLVAGYKFAFFGNYLIASMIINYVLLPIFYYKKRQVLFFISVVALITLVILVDEYILEQIYFPDTRGTYFPGLVFTLLETLPLIIIMLAFKLAWDFNKKQRELEQLKSLVKESELQYLKNQINPHFLFNNLNNLYAYAIQNSPKTPSIILELSSVLRYMLYDCKEDYVPLEKEVAHLRNYTALNELHIAQRGEVKFKEEIASGEFSISPLVLVVFIENAFKHSLASQSKDIFIDIGVKVAENGLLSFSCTNSFLPDYGSVEHSGIGLENVKKRLALLYPNLHHLDISVNNHVYQVQLTMQLEAVNSC
ncbi:MAG: histidine kinase [Bacteroidota bacterium]